MSWQQASFEAKMDTWRAKSSLLLLQLGAHLKISSIARQKPVVLAYGAKKLRQAVGRSATQSWIVGKFRQELPSKLGKIIGLVYVAP